CVLAERGDQTDGQAATRCQIARAIRGIYRRSVDDVERSDERVAVVAKEVRSAQCREGATAVDEATGDRASAAVVRILRDRKAVVRDRATIGQLEFGIALVAIPTPVPHPPRCRRRWRRELGIRLEVNLLDRVLTDVGDVQIVGRTVEAEG